MNALTRAVQDAIKKAPVSTRDIARRAGVSHVLLSLIARGKRSVTWPVAQAVAKGLREIEYLTGQGASRIERSLPRHKEVEW